jgi:hypothetical protein
MFLTPLENTKEQFGCQIEAAKKAEIYDHLFLAFGTLLGFVREGSIIGHDSDMDLGIFSDKIDVENINVYINEIESKGLFKYRKLIQYNPITQKAFWVSCKSTPEKQGYKCCHWFMFEHKGYMWHHKGNNARIKGIPSLYLQQGEEIEFLGQKVHIPKCPGSCLDYWYPDWIIPRKGGNSYGIDLIVKDWSNKSKWMIKI